eukprot:2660889-Prymnesium_polylepis.1
MSLPSRRWKALFSDKCNRSEEEKEQQQQDREREGRLPRKAPGCPGVVSLARAYRVLVFFFFFLYQRIEERVSRLLRKRVYQRRSRRRGSAHITQHRSLRHWYFIRA